MCGLQSRAQDFTCACSPGSCGVSGPPYSPAREPSTSDNLKLSVDQAPHQCLSKPLIRSADMAHNVHAGTEHVQLCSKGHAGCIATANITFPEEFKTCFSTQQRLEDLGNLLFTSGGAWPCPFASRCSHLHIPGDPQIHRTGATPTENGKAGGKSPGLMVLQPCQPAMAVACSRGSCHVAGSGALPGR